MNVLFVHTWVLYLLWLVPAFAAWWVWLRIRQTRRLALFVGAALQPKLVPAGGSRRAAWQIGLVAGGLLLMLIAAARPQWGERDEVVYASGRDLLIALDVSRSMLAADVRPNRLQRAKTDLMDLIRDLRGDRAGLVVFRYKAALLCPLTTDYAYLRQSLDAADVDAAPRGETDIGDAIAKSLDAFGDEEGGHRAIILISDGEDLSGKALDMARKAAERGVTIFTVGIGSRSGARIPDAERGGQFARHEGQDVVTKLNPDTLFEIARITGGAYIPIETAGMAGTTLGTIYQSHLRRIDQRESDETLQRRYVERFQIFLLPGLLLAIGGCLLSRGRLSANARRAAPPGAAPAASAAAAGLRDMTPPRRPLRNISVLLAVLLGAAGARAETTNSPAPAPSRPVPGRERAREAQMQYRLGRYVDAAEAYREAAAGASPASRRNYLYNSAAAWFKAGRYREAADALSSLRQEAARPDRPVAEGLGASLYRLAAQTNAQDAAGLELKAKLLREAAAAFQDAARNEEDESERRNLAVALRDIPTIEENARVARLMEKYGNQPPSQIVDQMLRAQRDINRQLLAARTNGIPERIRTCEALSRRQAANADLWVPLKGRLLEAMAQQSAGDTNAQQRMQAIAQAMEMTRDSMKGTSSMLRDAQVDGLESAQTDENAVYGFWKALAPAGMVVSEAMRRQTNALVQTRAAVPAADPERLGQAVGEQAEAGGLTRLFVERFNQQFPEGGGAVAAPPAVTNGAAATGTNAPALSEEDRRKILELAAQAIEKQDAAAAALPKTPAAAVPDEEASLALLREIEKLLPRQSSQQEQSQDGEQKDGEQQSSQEQKQEGQQQKSQEQQEQQSEAEQQEQAGQQKQEAQQAGETNAPPQDVAELIEKALQREREHEARKRELNRRIPMNPREKDW